MPNALLAATVALLALNAVLLVLLLRRQVAVDLSPLQGKIESLERTQERYERAVREEVARGRDETAQQARQLREETATTMKLAGDTLLQNLGEMTRTQKGQFDSLLQGLGRMAELNQSDAKQLREEIGVSIKAMGDSSLLAIGELGAGQKLQLEGVLEGLGKMSEANNAAATRLREELRVAIKETGDSSLKALGELGVGQKLQLEGLATQLGRLTTSTEERFEALKGTVEAKLQGIREDNTKQLDQMRQTVDEKLQGALEQRLGESFRLVGEQLEQVHRGLGEMRTLATGVGDLKKVLTNVKVRGTWGEVQLASLLDELLTRDQFDVNVATRQGSAERVEFAIRLPGRTGKDGELVWLPIDAKFPQEDYQRLVEAQECGDLAGMEISGKQLELRLRQSARDICDKYIDPPATTDFGIMFLPTEGLYAEAIRRVGLVESIQRDCRVMVAGPSTLAAMLNALQMGFRTLAIEKRSSEVWTVLGAVKTEFAKFGGVLDKVKKKLDEASNVVEHAQTRSRVMTRKLKSVEELPALEAERLLIGESLGASTLAVEVEEDPMVGV